MIDGKSIRNKLIGSDDERAVSPVIGVILMVAITVILAAVIAAFVLDMSPGGDSAPQANYQWNSDSDNVTVSHQSGDDVDMKNVEIRVEDDGGSTGTVTFDGSYSVGQTIDLYTNSTDVAVKFDGTTKSALGGSYSNSPNSEENISSVTVVYNGGDSGSIMTEYEP